MRDKCYCGKPLSEHYDANGEFGGCLDGEFRFDPLACPGCSGKSFECTEVENVVECDRCGGLITKPGETVNRNVLLRFVKLNSNMKGDCDDSRYFDFTYLRSDGSTGRTHGWYDPEDGVVVQYG